MDSFTAIFDQKFFTNIKIETNRYARQQISEAAYSSTWKTVTISTLYKFFAVILHMCMVTKPSIADYFSIDPILYSSFPSVVGMGRDKFKSILRYLHLNDHSTYIAKGNDGYDPLHKIRPVFEHLLAKFGELYTPRANITVDEAICPFRGRIGFRVYIKNKPHKYGMKVECVCESLTGMVCNMEIYTATGDTTVDALVTRLLEPFKEKNHHVFMDRRYSSPTLFKTLLERGFYPVGTVQANRKHLPKEFKDGLKKGQRIARVANNILATKCKDKKDVFILSTLDSDIMVNTINRRSAYHNHEVMKPQSRSQPVDASIALASLELMARSQEGKHHACAMIAKSLLALNVSGHTIAHMQEYKL